MLKGFCKSNIDNTDCYVTVFETIPREGESVAVRIDGQETTLNVVKVTHKQFEFNGKKEPLILIELNR